MISLAGAIGTVSFLKPFLIIMLPELTLLRDYFSVLEVPLRKADLWEPCQYFQN